LSNIYIYIVNRQTVLYKIKSEKVPTSGSEIRTHKKSAIILWMSYIHIIH